MQALATMQDVMSNLRRLQDTSPTTACSQDNVDLNDAHNVPRWTCPFHFQKMSNDGSCFSCSNEASNRRISVYLGYMIYIYMIYIRCDDIIYAMIYIYMKCDMYLYQYGQWYITYTYIETWEFVPFLISAGRLRSRRSVRALASSDWPCGSSSPTTPRPRDLLKGSMSISRKLALAS